MIGIRCIMIAEITVYVSNCRSFRLLLLLILTLKIEKSIFFFFFTYFLLLFNLRKHDDISSPIHPGYRLNISVYTLAGGGSTLAIVILSCEITQYRNLIKIFVVIKIKMKNCGDLL